MKTGEDIPLGTFEWGWQKFGSVTNDSTIRLKSMTSQEKQIIKLDYPQYKLYGVH